MLFSKQSSMNEADILPYSTTEKKEQTVAASVKVMQPSKPVQKEMSQEEKVLREQLETIGADSLVYHKKFGKGTVIRINQNEKYIHVKFDDGEKKFIFPDAFIMGYLII